MPRVLVLAGLDPSGGAGLGADTAVVRLFGAHPAPVPTCTTVQNRHGFARLRATPADDLRAMFDAAAADGPPVAAIKIGLLPDARVAALVAELIDRLPRTPVVLDPVLSATAGGLDAGGELVARIVAELLPRASVVTPNLPELERLAGAAGAPALLAAGAGAVLVKGGHADGDEVVDELVTAAARHRLCHPRIHGGPLRGTGCALASALAAGLAAGLPLLAAAERAVGFLARCIAASRHDAPLPEPLRFVAPEA